MSLLRGTAAVGFTDDFNDGDDVGWIRYDPFADVLGQPSYANFEFPDGNRLRISSPPSPAPTLLGAARAADLRSDISQTDFFLTIDLVGWNNNFDQIVGLLARGTNVGLGSTTGYLFMYNPQESETGIHGRLEIDRIDDEAPSGLAFNSISLDPQHAYRLAFTGIGPKITGQVFDASAGMALVATLQTTEATYSNGIPGLVVADAAEHGDGAADATFDNFSASVTAAKGDINRDGVVNAADIWSLLTALTDLNSYELSHGLTPAYLVQIADLNKDGRITNADIQDLLDRVSGNGNLVSAVPEPSPLALFILGAITIGSSRLRRRRIS